MKTHHLKDGFYKDLSVEHETISPVQKQNSSHADHEETTDKGSRKKRK